MTDEDVDRESTGQTPAERAFLTSLTTKLPDLEFWEHEDEDGRTWLMATRSFVDGRAIRAVLRLDFDDGDLRGGWSHYGLNGDNGVRAAQADVEVDGEDGLSADGLSPEQAAKVAAGWFEKVTSRGRDRHGRALPVTPRWAVLLVRVPGFRRFARRFFPRP